MPTIPTSARDALTALSGWPRRVAALLCLLAAALSALGTKPQRTEAVAVTVVARHTIAFGTVLRADDLSLIDWPARAVPPGAARSPTALLGRHAAATLPAGLPIIDDALLEPAIAAALAAGQVTTTVRLADAGQLAILHAGDRIDLYPGADPAGIVETRPARSGFAPIARDAQVLSISAPAPNTVDTGPTLVIAVDRTTASQLAAQLAGPLLATLVPPP